MDSQSSPQTAFLILLSLLFASLLANPLVADEIQLDDGFENTKNWEPTDPSAWKLKKSESGQVYSQFKKRSNYKPPHRSPLNISWRKEPLVSDFQLDVEVLSTHPDYGHRDACLFFGYQDAAHFHYVHLGKKADAHANQIFIVNKAPRTKISITTTKGTNWDDQWHRVKIIRTAQDGKIEVYFDDMKKPVMTAKDTTFQWGRVGLGSFDDTGHWDDIVLRGELVKKP